MANSPLFFLLLFLLLFSSKSNSQSTTQSNDELKTLLTIKQDWGNPAALSSWDPSTPHCNWHGVTCTNGQVTALSFPTLNITNPIPSSICNLENLSRANFSYNNFSSSFPTALYNCSRLEDLDLSNNAFTGPLPADINRLSAQLQHLNLSSNHFTGDVPPAIAKFPRLKSLVLDTNRFDGTYPSLEISNLAGLEMLTLAVNPFAPAPVPEEFGKLTNLTYLWLSKMNMTGEIPSKLSNLRNLTLFDLSMNKLHGTIPTWVWQLEKLQYLYLYSSSLTGEIARTVAAVNLVQIDLSMNALTGSIPEDFGKLNSLTLLFLYYNQLSGPIPASIGLLPKLYDIRLFNNALSGVLPPELGKHSQLVNLEVSNNHLSGQLPESLCSNLKLDDIVVFNNNFSGPLPANLGECHLLDNIMLYNNHFTGEFPQSIWSFAKLTTVMIHDNNFTGAMPTELSSNISRIEMGNNRFSGAIPTSATKLQVFKAANNLFTGEIPQDMTKLANLTDLLLAGNQISGSIPPTIKTLQKLNSLDLSSNRISGVIPPEIGLLPALTSLDLSDNELTGDIPQDFKNLNFNNLNLSANQLTGEVPASLQIPAYDGSFLGNPGLCAGPNANINLPTCGGRFGSHDMLSKGLIILFSLLAGIALVGTAVIGWLLLRRQKDRQDATPLKMTSFNALDFNEYEILSKLREENSIGSGGSGKVYRIHLGGDEEGGSGLIVAVKKIWNGRKVDAKLDKEFESEVKTLGEIRHNNIVKLLCCISSQDAKLLVYEYMENGSLDRWLHHRERVGAPAPLDWPTRLTIAIDAARGLCYMHHDCAQPIVHRDVKTSNILLDPEFRAKIADFGLARILVKSGEPESISAIGGTFGYMAPEYGYRPKVNEKVDVYSFGVVLLELTTGRVANDGGADCSLAEWAWQRFQRGGLLTDAIDEDIQDLAYLDDIVAVFTLGVICTGEQPVVRPSMKEVLHYLLRYNRTSSEANAYRVDYDAASFLQSKKGRRRKSLSDTGEWNDNEDSGNFVVRVV